MSQFPGWNPQQVAEYQYRQDGEHLQVLSVFYYIFAAFAALVGCFPLIYVMLGLLFAVMGAAASGQQEEAVAVGIGGVIVAVFFGTISLAIWGFAYCLFAAGRGLATATSHTFCFVMACIICTNMPLGTLLGIFTIITLSRPSVKARFEGQGYGGMPVPGASPQPAGYASQPTGYSQQPTAWQPPAEKKPPYQPYR